MGLDMYLNSRIYHSGITYDENKKMRERKLETEGFFFGSSEDHEQEKKENIKIFRDASAWLDKKLAEGYQDGDWFSIYYEASW